MNWKMINPHDLKIKQAIRNMVASLLAAVFLLVGCQGQSILDTIFPQAESQLGGAHSTPGPVITPQVDNMPNVQPPNYVELELWVPPQFDPNGEGEAAKLLDERIREFLIQNPQIELNVRVKALSGPGSMMDSMLGASSVAQAALPSLALLSRSDLVIAAERTLIFPIEEFSSSVDENDWYAFAQSMAIYQGSAYGLPFASNVLGLLHRPGALSGEQPSWDEIFKRRDSLLFPAGDADAMVTLAQYFSAGGALDVQMGKMEINQEALSAALNVYERARRAGVIGRDVLENQTDDQAWEKFQTGNADVVITWIARLFTADEDLGLAMLPPLGENPFTFATGWSWCLTEQDIETRKYAAALAEFLSAPEFLSQWAPVSGYLPVRPSSLVSFAEEGLQSTLSTMLMSAHLRPDRQLIMDVSPQIKIAVDEVINGMQTAEESAQNMITRLKESENQ